MKYVVVRTDSEREIVVVGKSSSKDEARTILRNDFEEWFWQKVSTSKDAPFEEVYAEYEDDECNLSEDSAWLNGCCHTDFDWQIIDTEVEDILSKPLSMKQMILATSDESTYVQSNIVVELDDIIGNGLEEFFDLLSEHLTGSPCLMDVNYKAIDTLADGRLVLHVSGDVSNILEFEDEMYDELKKNIFDAGADAMEDFLGYELEFDSDEDMMIAMDDVAAQMPDEELLRFYRKFVKI